MRAAALAFSCLVTSACAPPHEAAETKAPRTAIVAPSLAPALAPSLPPTPQSKEAAAEPVSEPALAPEAPSGVAAPGLPPIAIHKGTRVLMVGDSMVTSGLGVYLQEHVVARGGKLTLISKGSSTTATWNQGRELLDYITRLAPDVVIVALASNELFVPNPSARTADIRGIVKRIGSRPCVWIGPSPWLPEKGILGVVRENAAPCRYFDSTALDIERQADRIHPTMRGGKTWAEAVWQTSFSDAD
jgi:hypothetical protein